MGKKLFIEYDEIKNQVRNLENERDKLLDKKSEYFLRTQPKVSDPSKEMTTIVGGNSDKFLNYVANTQDIDEELIRVRKSLKLQKQRLKYKYMQLSDSKEILDKIYIYNNIKRIRVREFYRLLNYSKRQTYRLVGEINKKIKDGTK